MRFARNQNYLPKTYHTYLILPTKQRKLVVDYSYCNAACKQALVVVLPRPTLRELARRLTATTSCFNNYLVLLFSSSDCHRLVLFVLDAILCRYPSGNLQARSSVVPFHSHHVLHSVLQLRNQSTGLWIPQPRI